MWLLSNVTQLNTGSISLISMLINVSLHFRLKEHQHEVTVHPCGVGSSTDNWSLTPSVSITAWKTLKPCCFKVQRFPERGPAGQLCKKKRVQTGQDWTWDLQLGFSRPEHEIQDQVAGHHAHILKSRIMDTEQVLFFLSDGLSSLKSEKNISKRLFTSLSIQGEPVSPAPAEFLPASVYCDLTATQNIGLILSLSSRIWLYFVTCSLS